MIWPGCKLFSRQYPSGPHESVGSFFFQWSKLCETCPRIWQVSRPINVPIIINALLLLDIQICMCTSGDVNVFQWNWEWFFSRRVRFDSGFNVMAVYEVSWPGPKIIHRFTGIWKWIMRLWKRSCWFSKKVNVTLSLNKSRPYQGGCSQFLISSRDFDSSICDWKNKFSILCGNFWLPLYWVFLSRFLMRPSSPTPQDLRPVRHPSKFHPRTECIQRTIQVMLSFQIDGFLTGLSQRYGSTQPMKQTSSVSSGSMK